MFTQFTTDEPTFVRNAGTDAIVETVSVRVAARRSTVRRALESHAAPAAIVSRIDSLGLLDRLARGPELLEQPDAWTTVLGLEWRLDQPSPRELLDGDAAEQRRVRVTWVIELAASAAGGTLATVTVAVELPSDGVASDAALAVAEISRIAATRLLTRVRAIAQDADELAWEAAPR